MTLTTSRQLYIAGPYSAPSEAGTLRNIQSALLAGFKVAKATGRPVLIPHVALPDRMPWDKAMVKCRELLATCSGIVLMPRWRESRGARREREWAIEMGIPVLHMEDITEE